MLLIRLDVCNSIVYLGPSQTILIYYANTYTNVLHLQAVGLMKILKNTISVLVKMSNALSHIKKKK